MTDLKNHTKDELIEMIDLLEEKSTEKIDSLIRELAAEKKKNDDLQEENDKLREAFEEMEKHNFDMSIERHEGYKVFGGFKYHLNFPDEWILDELPDTGRECWNCVGKYDYCGYAMWRGIVLGYCANCALDYEGERGRGFWGCGIEMNRDKYKSAFTLYLGEVDFESLGDLEANPEDTLENRKNTRIDLITDYVNDSNDEDEITYEEYYQDDEDDFGECLHIGCGKAWSTMSPYCSKHARIYDR